MTTPPTDGQASWTRLLRVTTGACAIFPLAAVIALGLSSRLSRPLRPPPSSQAAAEPSPDMAIIESVLIQRAPELGLTLRRQVALAISEEASKAGYDPLLIVALIDVESDFQEDAVSEKGARGLMQIRPSTLHFLARREGLRLSRDEVAADPALCVRLGIRYLRDLNDRLGHLDLALMAYNAGPSRIRQAMREGGLEPFLRYPRLVRRDFRRFREGQGLGGDWAWAQREESE